MTPSLKPLDVRLPRRRMREITVFGLASFTGRWLAQHLDRQTGARWSVAQIADGGYVVISKLDEQEAVELRIFPDARTLRDSDLPLHLKPREEP